MTYYICYALIIMLSLFLGGALGSAVYCLVYRKRRKMPWGGKSRSHCDHCGKKLGVLELIPVLSYIFLKGKCKNCKGKIPAGSFYVELAWALVVGAISAAAIEFYKTPTNTAIVAIAGVVIAFLVLMANLPEKEKDNASH